MLINKDLSIEKIETLMAEMAKTFDKIMNVTCVECLGYESPL